MQPGEKLILCLDKLRARLNSSGTERTAGLRKAMGDDCTFYRKSLDIFLNRDYDDIEALLSEAKAEFDKLKGST
jgi:hypothetical protein